MVIIRPLTLLLLFCLPPCAQLWAQADGAAQAIGRWYLEQRFLIADNDLDGTLDPSEIKAIEGEFVYYLNGNHYDRCDLDRDKLLSREEVQQHAQQEWEYRMLVESRELEKLRASHPEVDKPDVHELFDKAELLEKLLSNYSWTKEHAATVSKLMSNRSWASRNPELVKQFHHNFRWLADHPQYASRLYRNPTWSSKAPGLREWRRNHQAFISAHPDWATGSIQSELPNDLPELELDITDNNSVPTPGDLVNIPSPEEEDLPDAGSQFILEDSIRVLRARLAQSEINFQRGEEKIKKLQGLLQEAENAQSTHLSQMRSERETLITTSERQRVEIQKLKEQLGQAEERLNYYIDLSGSSSDALREENVGLKAEKSQLARQNEELTRQKAHLESRILEIQKKAAPSPQAQTPGISLAVRDSLIQTNRQLEKDLETLGKELIRLADVKSSLESRQDSLQAITREQQTEIRQLNQGIVAQNSSIETELKRLQTQIDSVVGMNNMLSARQAEMKEDLRRLVRENALLTQQSEQTSVVMAHRSDRDSLLFETNRRQRELAILKDQLKDLKTQLNAANASQNNTAVSTSSSSPSPSVREAQLAKQLAEKEEQLQNMTDKFIDMAAEIQSVRKQKQQLDLTRDSLLALSQSTRPAPPVNTQQTEQLTATIEQQRAELKSLRQKVRLQEAFAVRSRMVFDSLVAITSKMPELQAGLASSQQQEAALSQAEVDLKKAERKIEELDFERQKLQEQLKLTLEGNSAEQSEFETRMEVAQSTISELHTEVKKLKAQAAYASGISYEKNQSEVLGLKQRIKQLELKLSAQEKQLNASTQYASETDGTIASLKQQVQDQKAEIAQLSALNRTLNSKLSTDMIPRTVMTDSLLQYRNQIGRLAQQLDLQRKLLLDDKAEARRQIETLEHQITQLEIKNTNKARVDQVTDSRIKKIEQQEAEIKVALAGVEERERMLRQQEVYIMGRLEELDKKEKRYQHLLQLEKELRLLEQRLKQHPDYEKSRNQLNHE